MHVHAHREPGPEPVATETIHAPASIDSETAGELLARVRACVDRHRIEVLELDLSDTRNIGSVGAAMISLALAHCQQRKVRLQLHGLDDRAAQLLRIMPLPPDPAEATEPELRETLSTQTAGWLGDAGLRGLRQLGCLTELLASSMHVLFLMMARRVRLPKGSVTAEIAKRGADAVPIVAILSVVLGMVTVFQAARPLSAFGVELFVADVVGLGMVRELGPLLAAIILAGRSGAAIASELGTMKVGHEIDALETMGIDPVRYLVMPRLLALTVALPALAVLGSAVGLVGGGVVAVSMMDVPAPAFIDRVLQIVTAGDVLTAMFKSVVFAWIIALSGCVMGMLTTGGANAVGRAATQAVVMSIFLVLIADTVFVGIHTMALYNQT